MYNIFRNDRVHVLARKCDTCIFRPGNLMRLSRGTVKEMVRRAMRDDTAIICHETLDADQHAVCRGFYDKHPTQSLQIAERLGFIAEVEQE